MSAKGFGQAGQSNRGHPVFSPKVFSRPTLGFLAFRKCARSFSLRAWGEDRRISESDGRPAKQASVDLERCSSKRVRSSVFWGASMAGGSVQEVIEAAEER